MKSYKTLSGLLTTVMGDGCPHPRAQRTLENFGEAINTSLGATWRRRQRNCVLAVPPTRGAEGTAAEASAVEQPDRLRASRGSGSFFLSRGCARKQELKECKTAVAAVAE
ncbi:hypothetical protein NDU88_004057 [Pleurodeles waltl]|uniref:Uncharacterized protein n=1 Tax=Pleurodeles waltl TaxID=8319 RepID=A0AAV7T883_PLEWA|nr:hypothetical protein NDU88_004057 [Pleurodeles waltl]